MATSGVSRISFWGRVQNFSGKVGVFAPCSARLLGGFGGMLLRENFLKWCNLVRFREYFAKILSKNNLKSSHFLYKNNR